MNLLEKANEFPPALCRLLARKNRGRERMSHREIAEKSGLSKSTVSDLSTRTSWNGIDIDTVEAFSRGCGIDLLRTANEKDFLRRRGLGSAFLRGGANERRMNAKLLEALKAKLR